MPLFPGTTRKKKLFTRAAISASLLIIVAALVFGCKNDDQGHWMPGTPLSKEDIVIGILLIDDGSGGWSRAHSMGIAEAQRVLGLRDDQIIRKYNVPDVDEEMSEYMISQSIAEGANIILATSWGYMDVCERLAAEHPNVIFVHVSGDKHNETNFTNCFGRIYQARYLAGIAAGMKTETGKIGFVAAHGVQNSEVTSGLNAFAMGVERVNPDARIYVRVTHSWFYPDGERTAAQALIAEGCDIITQHSDTLEPLIEAKHSGVWGIGYNVDNRDSLPDTELTSVIWNWGIYYTDLISSIINGSFTTTPFLGGMSDGIVDIAPLNPTLAKPGIEEKLSEIRESIISGEFLVFSGEYETNDGRIVRISGDQLSTTGMDWYYRNVVLLQ